jgi:ComF family protein
MPILQLQHMRYFIQQTLDLLFPPTCALCKKSGSILCPDCQQSLHLQESYVRCTHCHSIVEQNGHCLACRSHQLKLNGLRAYGRHQNTLRNCIHALKYDGQTRLAQPLGALLAQTYRRHGMQADFLVPLPLHAIRQKQRGYNHAVLLAQACAEELGVPVYEDLVMRHRATAAQVGLSSQQRHQNVVGAFSCVSTVTTRTIFKRSIIIIDDVCTTGATLEACAETLFSAGAHSVWGLVLARSGYSDTP